MTAVALKSGAEHVKEAALSQARNRLAGALRFFELNARSRPLFEKAMRLESGRRVMVGLYLPGPVLVQFDPSTGEVFTRSLPGQLEHVDPSFLDE